MKNSSAAGRLFAFSLAFSCLLFSLACNKAELAPYVKYSSDADVPRISLEDAKKDYDDGTAVIIDSRAEAAYKQEHITGALSMPIGSPEERFSEIPKGKKIIVYCS